jgi:hypothetical protein
MPLHLMLVKLLKLKAKSLPKSPKNITKRAKIKNLGTAVEDAQELVEEDKRMAIKDFVAHVTKKVPTRVKFKTRAGKKVRFTAEKPTRVKTHVHFKTRARKRG